MVGVLWAFLASSASAQVANGDFASGSLLGWTPGGVGGHSAAVTEGSEFSITGETATSAVAFPSAPTAAELWADDLDGAEGTLTQTLVITSGQLRLWHAEESALTAARVRIRDIAGVQQVEEVLPQSLGTFTEYEMPVDGWCGLTMKVELALSELDGGAGTSPWYGLFDDISLVGDPCDGYRDADGDGYCPAGVDLDGDGACSGPGEPQRFGDHDCDDADPAINPDAVEVPVDGIDEDCDGAETCHVDADLDGYGGAALAPGEGVVCGDQPGETATESDCDDADPAAFPGALEIPGDSRDDDCDGGEICWSDADGDGHGAPVEVVSDDPDCADPGEATTTDDCDDADPLAHPAGVEVPGDGVDQDCDGADEPATEPEPEPENPGEKPPVEDRGCGCASGGGPGVAGWLFVALAVRRRRR